ncbi:MAG TPA: hypothetical protein PLU87_04365 [Sedimentisphaerales bacterium]|nr:hypothetical protein [Sedimentisphaerales bacterium]HRS10169.1 hypothetical protein [Sedimentisphaerales bacterium]HRV46875.1 hypothetical protein [Sedimentisphaerales bacterium]
MITQGTIALAIILSLATLLVPKRYFLLPYIVAACFVPADQRVIIADLDFTVLRILVAVGVLRILCQEDSKPVTFNSFDKLVVAWALCGAIIYVLRWGSFAAVVNRCGTLFDCLGMYWLFRKSVTKLDDIKQVGRILAVCSLVMVVLVGLEWTTGQNPFVVLGRVGTVVREGEYRCQASFPHSIMLGLFWATVVPLFVGLWKTETHKWLYVAATAATVFIVIATRSSTPLLTLMIIGALLPLFQYRQYGRLAAWCTVAMLVALHIVMKAPVWHLIARINMVGGSTGWHRYHLINEAVNHFAEWAVLGTRGTAHWGWGLQDITNQYVLEGVRGGLITLILFVVLLVRAVAKVGSASLRPISAGHQWLFWGICISLFGHCVSFFGVSYFGQIILLLYLTLAITGWVFSNPRQLRLEEAVTAYRREHGKACRRIDCHRQLEHARHPSGLS